jgi:lipopolysaccharide biosynthesis glycosyltransferase
MSNDARKYTGPKIVVYGGTKNIYDKMARSAKSLLCHTDVDKVYFMIEDDEFDYPEKLPDNFTCINVSNQQYFPSFGPNYNTRSTYMSMMRMALYDMLPQYDRVLWLDDDTYILRDISDLFSVPLEDTYYAAMCDEVECYSEMIQISRNKGNWITRTYPMLSNYSYFNDGVAVLNLKKLRDGMGDTLIDALNTFKMGCADQDAFNEYCHEYIYLLPQEYNAAHFTSPVNHPKIYHYSGLSERGETKMFEERYNNLTFEEIVNWRKARKEYIANVRNKK